MSVLPCRLGKYFFLSVHCHGLLYSPRATKSSSSISIHIIAFLMYSGVSRADPYPSTSRSRQARQRWAMAPGGSSRWLRPPYLRGWSALRQHQGSPLNSDINTNDNWVPKSERSFTWFPKIKCCHICTRNIVGTSGTAAIQSARFPWKKTPMAILDVLFLLAEHSTDLPWGRCLKVHQQIARTPSNGICLCLCGHWELVHAPGHCGRCLPLNWQAPLHKHLHRRGFPPWGSPWTWSRP